MKKKLALLLTIALLTGCSTSSAGVTLDRTEDDTSSTQTLHTEKTETTTEPSQPIDVTDIINSEKTFYANGKPVELTDKEWDEVLATLDELQKSDRVLPKTDGDDNGRITIEANGETYNLVRVSGIEDHISVNYKAEYAPTSSINELFDRYCNASPVITTDEKANAEERLVGLSVRCDEPTDQQEYLDTARAIVAQWLDTLKTEEGRYHLASYTFTDDLADNRVFHGDGYVNGGREFVCYVGFDTPTDDDDTAFYAAGTYDTFYHYYFGPGVLARFRWEDGVCTLIDYDDAFAMLTSDRLKDGLYGISNNETEYKTFYDFMNDKDNVNRWLTKGLSNHLCRYRFSHNVMMLANGNIIFVDIGNSDRPITVGENVTTDMHKYFYDSKMDGKYSSPVDYVDGIGAVVMTYRDGFSIVFDDYNHDGNPDYALRIDSDEYGSTYDVRCMDINGTPWEDEDEIYIYGEFDESIRLQVSEKGYILKPVDDGNGGIAYEEEQLFSDKSNTSHEIITEEKDTSYRMYSQRFYLPEDLRCYTAEDSDIICYFWNNTVSPVSVGGAYEIQRKNGSNWETVATGTTSATAVDGNSYAEVSFNISGITSDEIAVYRIKTTVNEKTVYGGFYYGTSAAASIEISTGQFPSFADKIQFEVNNTGLSTIFPKAELYYGQTKLCDVHLDKLNCGDIQTAVITEDDISGSFTAGEYTLKITADGKEFEGTATVINIPKERLHYFPEKVPAELRNGEIVLTLTNNIWNEETVTICYADDMRIMNADRNGTMYMNTEFRYTDLAFGETIEIILTDQSEMLKEYEDIFEALKQDDTIAELDEEEYALITSMTFDEFVKDILGIREPQKGDLCRLTLTLNSDWSEEYVYFEMP